MQQTEMDEGQFPSAQLIIQYLTPEARGAVAGLGAAAVRALGGGGAHPRLHVDVRGGALVIGELDDAEQRQESWQ